MFGIEAIYKIGEAKDAKSFMPRRTLLLQLYNLHNAIMAKRAIGRGDTGGCIQYCVDRDAVIEKLRSITLAYA